MTSTLNAFIAGVVIVAGGTLFADLWRILARREPPSAADWACGPDLTVAGVALVFASLSYMGAEITLLWILVARCSVYSSALPAPLTGATTKWDPSRSGAFAVAPPSGRVQQVAQH